MFAERSKSKDYKTLSTSPKSGESHPRDIESIPPLSVRKNGNQDPNRDLHNPVAPEKKAPLVTDPQTEAASTSASADTGEKGGSDAVLILPVTPPANAEEPKKDKAEKKKEKDKQLLGGDQWLARNGHSITYV